VSVAAAIVAAAAWVGTAGLVFGFNGLPVRLEHRLPLQSPALGGIALAAVIAVPYSALAASAWRDHAWWPRAAVASGVVLVAWIVVELAFVRELSVLQPACVAAGAWFIWAGRRSGAGSSAV
jgi:hypothetical protein